MRDGSPQVTPVWVDTDGENVLVNTALGRVKTRNMERDPRVAIAVYDPAEPYNRVLNVRGRVIDITPEGANDHIDRLAKNYTGADRYAGHRPDQTRVTVTIAVEHTTGSA